MNTAVNETVPTDQWFEIEKTRLSHLVAAKSVRRNAICTLADQWWRDERDNFFESYNDSIKGELEHSFEVFLQEMRSHTLYALWILMEDGEYNEESMLEIYTEFCEYYIEGEGAACPNCK